MFKWLLVVVVHVRIDERQKIVLFVPPLGFRAYYSRSGKSGKRRCCSRSHLGTPESCSIRVTAVPITRDWASHKFLSLHYAARTLEPKYFRRIAGTRITRWIASQRCPKCAGQKLRLGSK